MTTARQSHTATLLGDGRVLIAGGRGTCGDQSCPIVAAAELYDPKTGTFTPTGSLPDGVGIGNAVALLDGRVLVTGLTCPSGSVCSASAAELYDPATGSFSPTGALPDMRWGYTVTTLLDGRVLVAGGYLLGNYLRPLASAELYDPKTGSFSRTGSMTTARWGHTATLLSDGRVLIAGGSGSSRALASAELYDPKTGKFTRTGSMTKSRDMPAATLLSNGRVLVLGGRDQDGFPVAAGETYDPKTGSFSRTGSMTCGTVSSTATLLIGGRVLIAGGMCENVIFEFAALYDPTTGSFSSVHPMANARVLHTATLLDNGRVLIAGGISTNNVTLASAELYQP